MQIGHSRNICVRACVSATVGSTWKYSGSAKFAGRKAWNTITKGSHLYGRGKLYNLSHKNYIWGLSIYVSSIFSNEYLLYIWIINWDEVTTFHSGQLKVICVIMNYLTFGSYFYDLSGSATWPIQGFSGSTILLSLCLSLSICSDKWQGYYCVWRRRWYWIRKIKVGEDKGHEILESGFI